MNDAKMYLNYRRLRNIERCNNFPTIKPIDVAQHSYFVTLLAMALVDEYNTYAEEHNLEYHPSDFENRWEIANSEKVIRKALLHDTEEAFTGDIHWNVKHMTEEVNTMLEKAIAEKIDKVYEGTSTMQIYHKLGRTCKEGLEGQFVAIADMMELMIFLWEEHGLANSFVRDFQEKCRLLIWKMPLAETLEKSSGLFRSLMYICKDCTYMDYTDIYNND